MHSYLIRLSQAIAATIPAAVLIVISLVPTRAHELTPAVGDLSFLPGEVILELELNLEAVLARIGAEHDDTDESPRAAEYEALRAMPMDALRARLTEDAQGFLADMSLMSDIGPVTMDLGPMSIPETGDTELARLSALTLTGALPEKTNTVTFAWSEDFGPLVLRAGADGDPDAYAAFLSAGAVSDPIAVPASGKQGFWARFLGFFQGWF